MIPHDPTIPTLPAYDVGDGDGCLVVWCLYCAKFHQHGSGGGHRVAHCIEESSAYQDSGYYLILAGKLKDLPPELLKERAKLTSRARRRRRMRDRPGTPR